MRLELIFSPHAFFEQARSDMLEAAGGVRTVLGQPGDTRFIVSAVSIRRHAGGLSLNPVETVIWE